MTVITRVLVAVSVLALAPLSAGVAGAATLSDTPSAVDQYVENVPTADGHPSSTETITPLSQHSSHALEAVSKPIAAALREVATSSAFGAPEAKLALKGSMRVNTALPTALPVASFAGSLKEMGGSLLSGGGRPLGLLVGLTAILLGAAVMARRKNRSAS